MIVVTVARKPLSEGTVASNALVHGTGALNIDATRIAHASPEDFAKHQDMVDAIKARGGQMGNSWKNSSDLANANDVPSAGRWPANLLLQHLEGCRQVGTKVVKASSGIRPKDVGATYDPHKSGSMAGVKTPVLASSYSDEGGNEEIAAWECLPGCPAADLDRQSGTSKSASGTQKYVRAETTGWLERGGSFTPGREWAAEGYGDEGGASRYFKAFGGLRK